MYKTQNTAILVSQRACLNLNKLLQHLRSILKSSSLKFRHIIPQNGLQIIIPANIKIKGQNSLNPLNCNYFCNFPPKFSSSDQSLPPNLNERNIPLLSLYDPTSRANGTQLVRELRSREWGGSVSLCPLLFGIPLSLSLSLSLSASSTSKRYNISLLLRVCAQKSLGFMHKR
jgi:hypothetical protein